ncbi:MAG: hypothetical protein GEV28_03355 [Actinophytocola sp.]|uniref:hypothetical protein n=1 Tax=Actinophytocola sp. TaxID=1872138 RepID=UPI00132405C7|nr:hypothetical protein [Actinophytocola sp.]MPZ79471.1 hypothetical protein [Actinophytocola sp.]
MIAIDQTFWLERLRELGWTQYRFGGDDAGPELVAHAFFWRTCADVVIVKDARTATAYRALPCRDVFQPVHITRMTAGPMNRVLREALTWPEPGTVRESNPMTAPPGCGLPLDLRRPVTIRPLNRDDRGPW